MGRKGDEMKVFTIFTLGFLLSVTVLAQQAAVVRGRVSIGTDKTVEAKVVLSDGNNGFETMTDSRGFFSFDKVPNGKYTIRAVTLQKAVLEGQLAVENGKTIFVEMTTTGGVDAIQSFGISEEGYVEIGAGTAQPISSENCGRYRRTGNARPGRFFFDRIFAYNPRFSCRSDRWLWAACDDQDSWAEKLGHGGIDRRDSF